ncbi:hypothetical protein HG263_08520 [Pseudoalteromonas sp. JBTF-M23]|uniref:Uncharacterized protein n=1 Tax=Pseudoalteromonas caenipelagi TaxID=2726988 RepID=A0A849VF85_9GAMM|nr:hypothetical protein [Pseudoalteromonas caenipelagi]NOU50584.1 hypothetical protein [Pseudoalteromonas caenipelagi]
MSEKESVQTLIEMIKQRDTQALVDFYQQSDINENIAQLKYLYQQAIQDQAHYQFFQDLVASFLEHKPLPTALIGGINDIEKLTFFTPALSASEGFSLKNDQGSTILHALLSQTKAAPPPFNYIRSLLLFERNESLATALATRNDQQLLPMECYLAFNPCFEPLAAHELTAALALLEAQIKQVPSEINTLRLICNHLKNNAHFDELTSSSHRIILLGAAFECPSEDVMTLLH